MVHVVSGLISGPGGRDLEGALAGAEIGEEEVSRVQSLASDLQRLVQMASKGHRTPAAAAPAPVGRLGGMPA